jgi:hypothetical protein
MYKIFSFLKRREGLSLDEFQDYYENHHIPLILSLAPSPQIYRRRYLPQEAELTKSENGIPYDVTTELGFTDEATFLTWMTALFAPGTAEKVIADEERFLDRSKTCAYAVRECITA